MLLRRCLRPARGVSAQLRWPRGPTLPSLSCSAVPVREFRAMSPLASEPYNNLSRPRNEAVEYLRRSKQIVNDMYTPLFEEAKIMGLKHSKREFTEVFRNFIDELFPRRQDRNRPGVMLLLQHRLSLYKSLNRSSPEVLEGIARQAFYAWLAQSEFANQLTPKMKEGSDMENPQEWYPQARMQKRQIHLHVGPTNSGKTYHALRRLESAKTGLFCGPLRLLAHEVYTRLNAKGVSCSLLTGDERRFPAGALTPPQKLSCTVEMAPMVEVDVVVVDEIQMIGHPERGWAWTGILLGSPAKEIHLCGESRTVPLIQSIVKMLGDELVIHNYNRLSPLRVMAESLKEDYRSLRKGDCVVLFNVLAIHAIRDKIEKETGMKAAIIYGSLPPETRAQQAQLFNDPDSGYDILIASDAIGMGLNLSIRRVVFFALDKHDGENRRGLNESEIKQIAGRAGRFRPGAVAGTVPEDGEHDPEAHNLRARTYVPSEQTGWVTTFAAADHPDLVRGMAEPPAPIRTAGLQPPTALLKTFVEAFHSGTPYGFILHRLEQVARLNPFFHICSFRSHLVVADALQQTALTTHDRITMSVAPVGRNQDVVKTVVEYGEAIARNDSITILDLPSIRLELLDEEPTGQIPQLRLLEALHQRIVVFLWLSFQFPSTFRGRALAMEAKYRIEQHINACLERFSDQSLLSRIQEGRRIMQRQQERRALLENVEDDGSEIVEDEETAGPKPKESTIKESKPKESKSKGKSG